MCKLEWNRVLLTMALTIGAVVSMPTIEQQERHFEYSPRHKFAKTLTTRDEVKIYSYIRHLFHILVVSRHLHLTR